MGFLGKKKSNTRESSSGELAAAEKTLSSAKPEITAAGVESVEISSPTDAVDGRDDVTSDKNIKATRLIKKSNNNNETRDMPITMHKRASTTIGGKGSSGRSRAFSDDSNLNKCRDPPRPKSVPNASLPSSPGKAYKKTVSNSDRTRVTSNKKYVDDKETPRVSNLTTEKHVRSAESLKKKLHILSLEEESSMASSFDSSYISGDDDDDDDSASEYTFDDTIDRGISKSYSTDLSTADGTTRSRSFVETMWSKARKGVGIMSPNNSTIASSMAGTSFDDTLGSKSFDDTLGSKSLSTCSSGDTADEIEVDKAAKEKEGGKGGVKKTIASPKATVVKMTSPKAEPSPKASTVKNPSAGPSPKVSSPEAGAATATKEEEEVATDEVAASQSNGVASTKKPVIKVTKLVSNYLMEMEKFRVKSSEAQLLLRVAEHGNVTKMSLRELDSIPKPNKPDEIVIKIDCSTITLQDCMVRRGKWYDMQSLPFVPGSDFVGTIFEMGPHIAENSKLRVGDKVTAVVPAGGNAKYITVPYQSVIRVPNETDSAIALCLSSTYVPAREALELGRKHNAPYTNANILIIGGNGASGLAMVELALLEGANVFATADERHHEYLKSLGAKCFPIDPSKWLPTLQGKIDVVLDSVCLDGYESSQLALNPSGTLVCTGMSAVFTQGKIRSFGMNDARDMKAMYCRMKAKYFSKNTVYYDRMERYHLAPNEYAQHFTYLCHLVSKNTIKPLVAARAPLNLVASVQVAIEHGDTTHGVCICTPWEVYTDPMLKDKEEEKNTPGNKPLPGGSTLYTI